MVDKIKPVVVEFKESLSALYGARLKGVYLFGSYARNDADEESDLDILIVLDELENYSREVEFSSEVVSSLSLRYGVSISCVYASEKRWREDQALFFLNLREEAIPA